MKISNVTFTSLNLRGHLFVEHHSPMPFGEKKSEGKGPQSNTQNFNALNMGTKT
jgi:hypothetical protein